MTVEIGQAYADYYSTIGQITADRDAIFATDANTEQTADQAAVAQYEPLVQATSDALTATVSAQDQAFNTAADQADAAQDTANGIADGVYNTAKQAADAQEQSAFDAADVIEAAAEASDNADFQSQVDSASADLNSAVTTHQNTFDTTTSALQATHDTDLAADQAALDATLAANAAAFDATRASLDSVFSNTNSILQADEQDVVNNNWVSPGMYGSVANDPGYQDALTGATNAFNSQMAGVAATRDQAYANADAAEQTKITDAETQQAIANQNAENAYDVTATAAENQYNANVQIASNAESSAFADHLLTYLQAANAAEATYNSGVQQAQIILTTATDAATSAYSTGAQSAQDGFNSWNATRSATYNTAVQNRQNQLAIDNQAAQDAYNTAAAGFAATDIAADQQAVDDYNATVAGLQATRSNKDVAAYQAFSDTMAAPWTAEQNAEADYNQTVMQIYMDAMNNNVPPDQGALDAALTSLETARKAFDLANANANITLVQATTQDAVDYWLDELDAEKAEQVATAAADGAYLVAIAGAQETLTDAQADNQAACDTDLAILDGDYQKDVDQHQADLQMTLAALAKTRDDAIDDAQGADADSEADYWQTEQTAFADANAIEAKEDSDAGGVFKHAVAGFWQAGVNVIAAAQQQLIHDEAAAQVTASDAINQAQGQNLIDHAAADVAFNEGEAAAISEFDATTIDAWASTLIGFAPNDPAVQAVAAAVSNYLLSMSSLAMAQAGQLGAAQQQEVGENVGAIVAEAHAEAVEDQTLANGVAAAAVQQTSDDAGSQVAFNSARTDAAVSATKKDVDAARTAVGSYLSAAIADAHQTIAAAVTQVHSYLTNAATWVATVVPEWISTQVAEINAAAQAAGDVAHDKANVIKLFTVAGKARLVADVPAEQDAVANGAAAMKLLQLGVITDAQAQAIMEAQATGQWVLQNPLQNYVFAPVGPNGSIAWVNKATLPPPFNMIMDPVAKGPFDLYYSEQKLLTDMPSLQAATSKADGILHERMETDALLVRMQVALVKANDVGWPDRILPRVTEGVDELTAKYIAVMNQAAEAVERRTLSVENVALQGLQRNGVLVRDRVTGKGIFVTNNPESKWSKILGLQGLKVEDWAQVRREEIQALINTGDPADMALIDTPPLAD